MHTKAEAFTHREGLRWSLHSGADALAHQCTVLAGGRVIVHHSFCAHALHHRALAWAPHLFPYGNFHQGFKYP